MHPAKGYAHLLEAAPRVLARAPNCHFLFVGEGPLERTLTTVSRRPGLADTVHLLGVRSDIPRVLLAGDIMVLASVEEGPPNVVLKAWRPACRLWPRALAATPSLSLTVSGLLHRPPTAWPLADALLSLIEDPAEARAMGAKRARACRHALVSPQTTAEYLTLFAQILQSEGVELHIEPVA
ncbi:MAG: glycosyltransferase [Candidatus Promineofilum sp.]|nr:glycosyltransferase [Promineifilum sp.]